METSEPPPAPVPSESVLDRPAARIVALGVVVLVVVALGYIHREDIFADVGEAVADDPRRGAVPGPGRAGRPVAGGTAAVGQLSPGSAGGWP